MKRFVIGFVRLGDSDTSQLSLPSTEKYRTAKVSSCFEFSKNSSCYDSTLKAL